jgi:16S rRNA (cytosine967-C5)-methyltransferase
MMKNEGNIIAMDVEGRKLKELEKRALHQGVGIISTELISTKVLKSLEESADRLLLDVPCSGTGVIKRKPDTKWKLQPAYLENVQNIQAEIIRTYSKMLKRGGKMVYATCSILPSENERQVEAFLNESTDYQLLEQHRILPKNGSDAYYMALIEKK